MAKLPRLEKSKRITGVQRDKLGAKVRKVYEAGKDIREIAEQLGRSYGFAHRLLLDAGAVLRAKGGCYPDGRPRKTRAEADADRALLAQRLKLRYDGGSTSDALARAHDLSPSFVLTLLREAGTVIRKPGTRK